MGAARYVAASPLADRNFKDPSYTLAHVRYRLERDAGVLERGPGSVGGNIEWPFRSCVCSGFQLGRALLAASQLTERMCCTIV